MEVNWPGIMVLIQYKRRATGRQGRRPNASYRTVAVDKLGRENKLLQVRNAEYKRLFFNPSRLRAGAA
jgi:hypothetical protein